MPDPNARITRAVVNGSPVEHRGPPPFRAISASRHTDDWPLWVVVGTDNINWISFPDKPGAVLIPGREGAEMIAAALNRASGAKGEGEGGGADG